MEVTYLSLNFGALTIRITNTGIRFSFKLFKKKKGKFFSVPSSTIGKTISYKQMSRIIGKFKDHKVNMKRENIHDVRNASIKGISLSNRYIDKIKSYRLKTNIAYGLITVVALVLIYLDIFTALINYNNVIFSLAVVVVSLFVSLIYTKISVMDMNFKDNLSNFTDMNAFIEKFRGKKNVLINTGIYTVEEKREYCNLDVDYIFEEIDVDDDLPEGMSSSEAPVTLKPWNQEFYFTKECLIVEEENEYAYYDYGNMKLDKKEIEFTYKGPILDYLKMEKRWLYINKDGSKDKRYSDNVEIDVYTKNIYTLIMDDSHSISILI